MIETLLDFDEEIAPEELAELGSYNHSYLQAKLSSLFFVRSEYTPFTELSLDVSGLDDEVLKAKYKDSIKPDICLYPNRSLNPAEDILKMTEMPLLAIEILSPMQGVHTLQEKIKVYFALGVQSCWLVYPSVPAVTVYQSAQAFHSYSSGDVVDDALGIRIPLADIIN
ncbi:MAG: Uma2 family endonuclease [Chloroflexota bacterium]